MAVEAFPIAEVKLPNAVDIRPDAVVLSPVAKEKSPIFEPSQLLPPFEPSS